VLLSNVTAGRAWVELVLGLLLLLVWIVVAESALYVMTLPWRSEGAAPSDDLRTLFIPTVGLRTLGVVGVLALLLRGPGGGFRTVGLARSGWGLDALIGVGATAVAYALMIILMTVMWLVWPGSFEQLMENGERLTGMIPKLHPLLFLPVAICIGVYEELLFRGFLMTRLRRGTGSWTVAVLVSTGAFTALHAIDQTPLALVAIASLSLVASVVTIRRRSITPAIVTHALFDYTQFLSLYLQAGETWT
jgi:membrane protease YdiL (CAAX protease family)